MKRKNIILFVIVTLFSFLSIFLLFTNCWIYNNFGDVKIQEILFTLLAPTSGTDMSLVYSFILKVLLPTIFLVILFILVILFLHKKMKDKSFGILNYLVLRGSL